MNNVYDYDLTENAPKLINDLANELTKLGDEMYEREALVSLRNRILAICDSYYES